MSKKGCWKPRTPGDNGGKKWLKNEANPNWVKYLDFCSGELTTKKFKFVNTLVLPPAEGETDAQCSDIPCRELSDKKWINDAGDLVDSGDCSWEEGTPGVYNPGQGYWTQGQGWTYTVQPTWTPATGTWTCQNTKATRAERTIWNCGDGKWGTMQKNPIRTTAYIDDTDTELKFLTSDTDTCQGGGDGGSSYGAGNCECHETYAFNGVVQSTDDGASIMDAYTRIECPHTNAVPGEWYTSDWCQSGEESCRAAAIAALPRKYKDSAGTVYDGPGFEYADPDNSSEIWPVEGPYNVNTDVRYTEYFWKNYTVDHVMAAPLDYDVEHTDGTYWKKKGAGVQSDGSNVISTGEMTANDSSIIAADLVGTAYVNNNSVSLVFDSQMVTFDNATGSAVTDASENAEWAVQVTGLLAAWDVDTPQHYELDQTTGSLSQSLSMGPIYKYGENKALLTAMDTDAIGSLSIDDASEALWRSNNYTNASGAVPLQGWEVGDESKYSNTMLYDRSDWTQTAFVYQWSDIRYEEELQTWMDDNCYEADGVTLKDEYSDPDADCDVCDDPEFPGNASE